MKDGNQAKDEWDEYVVQPSAKADEWDQYVVPEAKKPAQQKRADVNSQFDPDQVMRTEQQGFFLPETSAPTVVATESPSIARQKPGTPEFALAQEQARKQLGESHTERPIPAGYETHFKPEEVSQLYTDPTLNPVGAVISGIAGGVKRAGEAAPRVVSERGTEQLRVMADVVLGAGSAAMQAYPPMAVASALATPALPLAAEAGYRIGGEEGAKIAQELVGVATIIPFGAKVILAMGASRLGSAGAEKALRSEWAKDVPQEDKDRIVEGVGHIGFFAGLFGTEMATNAGRSALRIALTKQVKEHYKPEELVAIWKRVDRGNGTTEETDFVRTMNDLWEEKKGEALRTGVTKTTTTAKQVPEWLQKLAGIEATSTIYTTGKGTSIETPAKGFNLPRRQIPQNIVERIKEKEAANEPLTTAETNIKRQNPEVFAKPLTEAETSAGLTGATPTEELPQIGEMKLQSRVQEIAAQRKAEFERQKRLKGTPVSQFRPVRNQPEEPKNLQQVREELLALGAKAQDVVSMRENELRSEWRRRAGLKQQEPQPERPIQEPATTPATEATSDQTGGVEAAAPSVIKKWYRGTISTNKSGDQFFSTSEDVATEYGTKKVGSKANVTSVDEANLLKGKKIYEAVAKDDLAEELGIELRPESKEFDAEVKKQLKAKGYDGVRYENGTFSDMTEGGAEELHLFGEPTSAAPSVIKMVEDAGGKNVKIVDAGTKYETVHFDNESGSTVMLKTGEVTPEKVAEILQRNKPVGEPQPTGMPETTPEGEKAPQNANLEPEKPQVPKTSEKEGESKPESKANEPRLSADAATKLFDKELKKHKQR